MKIKSVWKEARKREKIIGKEKERAERFDRKRNQEKL